MKTKKTHKRPLTLAASVAAVALLCCGGTIAFADDSASDSSGSTTAIVAERSFPKTATAKTNYLAESTSTDVDEDSDWGGVESLDVPHTQSTAEKEAEAAAEAAAQAQAEAEAEEAAAAASRSQSRSDVSTSTSTSTSDTASSDTTTTTTTTTTVASSGSATGAAIAALAQQYVGVPYVSGGASPSGWDCSGLVMWVYSQFGYSLPHSSGSQATLGTAVSSLAAAQPGDIIANNGHAAIYIGNGLVVNALNPSQGTQITAVGAVSSFASGYSIRRLV